MTRITFIENNGRHHEVDATDGESIMSVAVGNGIAGIVGDCGGCCSCATCHAYVEPASPDLIAGATEDELFLLEGCLDVLPSSRLTCQIKVSPLLSGLVVKLPPTPFP